MQYTFDFDVEIMLYGLKAPFRTTFLISFPTAWKVDFYGTCR